MLIAVTGASGQLGRLVMDELLAKHPAGDLVAVVRDPGKVRDFAERGVQIRVADYNDAGSVAAAFAGVDRVLLISANEVGRRIPQHRNVIEAAVQAQVKQIVYTSLLHADRSPLALATEHIATEKMLQQSGLPFIILRNGWYTENYLASVPSALQYGVLMGAAGDGKIASAARADYASAAVAVLLGSWPGNQVIELAGDDFYTLSDFAGAIAQASGKPISYQNLSEEAYADVLKKAGLPDGFAALLAQSDAGAAQGGLFDDGHALGRLIGRPTTPWRDMVKAAVA